MDTEYNIQEPTIPNNLRYFFSTHRYAVRPFLSKSDLWDLVSLFSVELTVIDRHLLSGSMTYAFPIIEAGCAKGRERTTTTGEGGVFCV